jgi:ligand-binding SRPBCC domain-containing protein
MYILERQQRIHTSIEQAWDFLRDPANLDRITPPDLQFRIVSDVPPVMYNGLIVEYRITIPLIGTHTWVTEIKHIREGHSFVDEQRLGPYRFWYHYHEIQKDGEGVLLIDRVSYQPPFSLLGRLLHWLYIRKNLERIFEFRRQRLQVLLSGQDGSCNPEASCHEGKA